MIDPQMNSAFDQQRALLLELLPPLWRGIYGGCLEQGFSEQQAREILKAYILLHWPGGGRI